MSNITLNEKSLENSLIVDFVLNSKKGKKPSLTHAIASRPYYSVFQKWKHLAFPIYEQEKIVNANLKQKDFFPHGPELVKKINGLITSGKFVGTLTIIDLQTIDDLDWLYDLRYRADYKENHPEIQEEDVKKAKEKADNIISVLDKLTVK